MKLSWFEPLVMFDEDSGADGGGSIGEVGGDNGPPAPPSNTTETGHEAAPSTPPAIPSKPAADGAPSPASGATVEPGPVEFNTRLSDVFRPVDQRRGDAPPQDRPASPQQAPQRPTAEMWTMEPDKAAAMHEAYTEWRIEQGIAKARAPVDQMRREQQAEKSRALQAAAEKAEKAVKQHWENVLNRDRDFRANKDLQEMASNVMGQFIAAALNNGSVEDLQHIESRQFALDALYLAKARIEGIKSYTAQTVGGPTVVGQQNPKGPSSPLIDEETAAALDEASRWAGKKITAETIASARKRADEFPW